MRRLLHTKKVISRYKMDNEVDEKAFKELAAFVIEAIVIPVGGGGLIAGTAKAVKTMKPDVMIIGELTFANVVKTFERIQVLNLRCVPASPPP